MWMPIWVIFLTSRGITLTELAIADGLHRLVNVLLEVPMGFVSDKWGHRVSLVLGAIVFVCALVTLAFTTNFFLLLLSWILWSLSVTLTSGADEAFLYESLDTAGLGARYRQYYGRSQMAALLSSALGSLVATPLYKIVAILPIAINAFMAFLASIFMGVTKPAKNRYEIKYLPLAEAWQVIRQEMRREKVGAVIMIGAVAYALFWSSTLFYQPYLLQAGVPLDFLGMVYVLVLFSGAFGAYNALRISRRVGDGRLIAALLIILWLAGLPMALSISAWAIAGIVVIWLGYYVINSIVSDILQKLVNPDIRATVSSMRSFIGSLLVIFTRVIAGTVADNWELQTGLIVLLFLLLPCTAVGLYLVRNINHAEA